MFSAPSGVSAWTTPSVRFQNSHTCSSAWRALADPPNRRTSWWASSAFCPAPSTKTTSRSWPSGTSSGTCTAAHGSRPAPVLPDRYARCSAAGSASVPLRPRNSARLPVTVRAGSVALTNAVQPANSRLYTLRANSAPVFGSVSVTTCIRFACRHWPSTHSQYPVTDNRRSRPERLRSFTTTSFTGASSAT